MESSRSNPTDPTASASQPEPESRFFLTDHEIIFARTMAERQWEITDTAMLILLSRLTAIPLSGISNTYMALIDKVEDIVDKVRQLDGSNPGRT